MGVVSNHRWHLGLGRSSTRQPIMVRSSRLRAKGQTSAELHPSPDELSGFALGSLAPARSAVIEAHVYGCDRCGEAVANAPGDEFLDELRASRATNYVETDGRSSPSHDTVGLPLEFVSVGDLPLEIRNHPRFEIQRLIAEGAMGRVYFARREIAPRRSP